MVTQNQYAPILKCKEGEFKALNKLSATQKNHVVPIIDIVDHPVKSFEDQIKATLNYLTKWDSDRLMYLDGYMVQEGELIFSGQHYMQYVFDELNKTAFNIIPVISNTTNTDYNEVIKNILLKDHKGVCVRIFRSEMRDINYELDTILNFLEITPASVDLLLDLESVDDLTINEILDWSVKTISEIKHILKYRSLIISGGNFPINLIKLKADQVHVIQRKQWLAWQKICSSSDIERIPAYSDYAISHPQISEFGVGIPNASASIRYTNESDYIIYRGKGTRQHSFDQFFQIAESLINSDEYYGKLHCPGDEFIYQCGTEKEKPGSLTTWRWVGTIHHLTVVVNQLLQFWRDFKVVRTS
ncbi:MAG: beta family protein [Bacteroidota bacterium]